MIINVANTYNYSRTSLKFLYVTYWNLININIPGDHTKLFTFKRVSL